MALLFSIMPKSPPHKSFLVMTEKELEDTAKKFNRSHRSYAHYLAGLAVFQFVEGWHENCDMMNACGGAIAEFFDLMGIYEPDNIDFDDT